MLLSLNLMILTHVTIRLVVFKNNCKLPNIIYAKNMPSVFIDI